MLEFKHKKNTEKVFAGSILPGNMFYHEGALYLVIHPSGFNVSSQDESTVYKGVYPQTGHSNDGKSIMCLNMSPGGFGIIRMPIDEEVVPVKTLGVIDLIEEG